MMQLQDGPCPDFAIAGAMKAGTTTLHHILASHPRVFIPPGEVKLFAVDDPLQQRHLWVKTGQAWTCPDFERDLALYLPWYHDLFSSRKEGQVTGEDSPSYLASEKAPERMARLLPGVKIIVLLRDPVARAYSHYWHNVRSFRAFCGFSDSLRYMPDLMISRSLYKRQIEQWLRFFPRERLRFVVFEEFVSDPKRTVCSLCRFLGLPPEEIPDAAFALRKNVGYAPRRVALAFLRNRLFRNLSGRSHAEQLPGMPALTPLSSLQRLTLRCFDLAIGKQETPEIDPDVCRFLSQVFQRENRGLSELIDIDLSRWWPSLNQS